MRIGILGTGNVARALATAWAATGHDVLLGSRHPRDRAGLDLPVATLDEAAAHADVIVNATPGTESLPLLTGVGAPALSSKVLIDIAIGFTENPSALSHPVTSLAEEIQGALPQTRVVKTLCTVTAAVMAEPGLLDEAIGGPGTIFLSGDDPEAKRLTGRLLTDLGWPEASQLDLGGVATARGQEHFALLFLGVAGALGTHTFNIKVVGAKSSA
jgi:8-hydroxy-5-deazaflavin:NADPH oxidoreductase